MTENPYFENLTSTAYDEFGKWKQRARDVEESDDYDLTEEEVVDIAEEMYNKFYKACDFREDYTDTLPSLLIALSELASEWNANEWRFKERGEKGDFIRSDMYGIMSIAAWDERERVQFIVEEYL